VRLGRDEVEDGAQQPHRTTTCPVAAADSGNGSTARKRKRTVRISDETQSGDYAPSTSVPSLMTPNTATRSLRAAMQLGGLLLG